MESARDGERLDRAGLEALYVRLERPMFNVVYRWLWNATDAQEVTQEAFLRVWDARNGISTQDARGARFHPSRQCRPGLPAAAGEAYSGTSTARPGIRPAFNRS